MLLSELKAKYAPIYPDDHTWEATVKFIMGDPIESETVNELVKDLKAGIPIRKPVTLGEATINKIDDVPTVVDGTHRVVAHIVAEVDEVPVEFYIESDDEEEPEPEPVQLDPTEFLETKVVFSEPLDEYETDMIFSILRSMKISDEIWLTSSVGSGRNQEFTTIWDLYDDEYEFTAEFMETVTSAARERLNRFGFDSKQFTVETETVSWDE